MTTSSTSDYPLNVLSSRPKTAHSSPNTKKGLSLHPSSPPEIAVTLDQSNHVATALPLTRLPEEMFKSEKDFKILCPFANSNEDAAELLGIDLYKEPLMRRFMTRIYKSNSDPDHVVRVSPFHVESYSTIAKGLACQSICAEANKLAPKIKYILQTPTHCFIVSEHINGPTLLQWDKDKTHAFQNRLEVFLKLAKTVQGIHNLGIAHGTICLNSAILENNDSKIRLDDFNEATHLIESDNSFEDAPPKKGIYANEQSQQQYDVDIISLGRILLELLTDESDTCASLVFFDTEDSVQTYLRKNLKKELSATQKHLEIIGKIVYNLYKFGFSEKKAYPIKLNLDFIILELTPVLSELKKVLS